MVEICGVKYIEGVSKSSGKPYAAFLLMYTEDGAAKGFEGYTCGDAFVNVSLLNGRKPKVGDRCNFFYNKSGFLTQVEFV